MAEPLDITLTDESRIQSRWSVRAADDTPAAAALGLSRGRAGRRDGALVARIRRDEWLVLGGDGLVASLDLSGFAHAVDLTHGRLQFRLTGPDARRLLTRSCSIDLGDHMTPDGACTGTSVVGVATDLVRDDTGGERSYLLLCDASYHEWLWATLEAGIGG